ncbi:hypothetical protein QBZ16_003003 [Prototheca wickerhamii]|uniref:Uncharacterized protein n=1 Tax=Prototheca wickerhamii TaxID=3111 RepID=A0AAD9IN04_PROWI|nr:hypothetical protein QBZ16_003003 [Prototheca wickerhamii]
MGSALCWNTGVAGTNSRKLLEESDTLPVLGALIASCGKTYRFQWWGWALQVAYMAITTGLAVKAVNVQGLHHVGTVSTALAIIYANDTLKAVDDAGGVLYSRLTTTFIGFMLIALSNLLGFLSLDCFTTICNRKPAACGVVSKAAATEAPAASEVLATAA